MKILIERMTRGVIKSREIKENIHKTLATCKTELEGLPPKKTKKMTIKQAKA